MQHKFTNHYFKIYPSYFRVEYQVCLSSNLIKKIFHPKLFNIYFLIALAIKQFNQNLLRICCLQQINIAHDFNL